MQMRWLSLLVVFGACAHHSEPEPVPWAPPSPEETARFCELPDRAAPLPAWAHAAGEWWRDVGRKGQSTLTALSTQPSVAGRAPLLVDDARELDGPLVCAYLDEARRDFYLQVSGVMCPAEQCTRWYGPFAVRGR